MSRIMVLGATGYTGRLIVAELQRKGLAFGVAGRSATRLKALQAEFGLSDDVPVVVANPLEPPTLAGLFKPEYAVGLLINCAGPFTSLGEPVVRAALEHSAHYLDITGEQAYIARVISRCHLLALAQKRVVVPGCGFEYTISNWCAALAAQGLEPLDSLATATAVLGMGTSQGTQRSVFATLSSYGLGWRDGRRVTRLAGGEMRRFKFPPPFGEQSASWSPFGDTVTLPRHIQAKRIDAYLALPTAAALGLRLISPVLPIISTGLGFALDKVIGLRPRGPDEARRTATRWAVVAEAKGPQGQRTATLQGRDVYGLTAIVIVWAAEQMLLPGFDQAGVLGPAQVFDPAAAVAYLKDFGVQLISAEAE